MKWEIESYLLLILLNEKLFQLEIFCFLNLAYISARSDQEIVRGRLQIEMQSGET